MSKSGRGMRGWRLASLAFALACAASACSRAEDGSGGPIDLPDEADSSSPAPTNTGEPSGAQDAGTPEAVDQGGLGGSPGMTPDPPDDARPDSSAADASPKPGVCGAQSLTFDQLFELIQADVEPRGAVEQIFGRYVTLIDRFNAGVCQSQLDADRLALNKAINMLSTNSELHGAVAVDPDGLLYRIDLRDYAWDRAIEIDGIGFDDAWEALIARDPYAVPFIGDAAEEISGDTGTDVPVVFSSALMHAALNGALYYALIDVNAAEGLDTFIRDELVIDVDYNLAFGDVVRAGTSRSAVARGDRLVERHSIENRPGAFWQTFDFDAASNDTFFEDPLGVAADGRLAIFTLRNGLFGFIGANAQGQIVDVSSSLVSADAEGAALRTASSCLDCHARGLLPVVDEVRSLVLGRPLLPPPEGERILEIYLTSVELQSVVAADNTPHLGALAALGVSLTEPEPISTALRQFNQSLDLGRAAAELGVLPAALRAALPSLSPSLSVLGADGTIARDAWKDLYRSALCAVSADSRNRPAPGVCAP